MNGDVLEAGKEVGRKDRGKKVDHVGGRLELAGSLGRDPGDIGMQERAVIKTVGKIDHKKDKERGEKCVSQNLATARRAFNPDENDCGCQEQPDNDEREFGD